MEYLILWQNLQILSFTKKTYEKIVKWSRKWQPEKDKIVQSRKNIGNYKKLFFTLLVSDWLRLLKTSIAARYWLRLTGISEVQKIKAKKVVLFPEIGWVKIFLSLTRQHSQIVSEYIILISKKTPKKQQQNKTKQQQQQQLTW